MGFETTATTILAGSVRQAVPLSCAASGEFVAERAGTLNISIEGMMLAGAYTAARMSEHGVVAGLVCAMLAGLAAAAIQAQMCHRLNANPFVVGLVINVLALGLTSFLLKGAQLRGEEPSTWAVPLLHRIPIVGDALFDLAWPMYLVVPVVATCWWLVHRSRWGLEARAVGENPQAADVSGIPVNARRRQAIYVAGMLAGLGGALLSLVGAGASFTSNQVAGRGFLAIAAVIFGGWTLRGTVAGCVLFGAAVALQLNIQALGWDVNRQLLAVFPYLLTLAVMAVFAKRRREPAALGRPFERGIA
jgi:general nucleoside transport system permease protein